jgi:hypothetical protein
MANGDFDLAKLVVDPADPRFRNVGKRKKWRRHFMQFPEAWFDRMGPVRSGSTYRLALLLVYEHWRTGGRPIELSNIASKGEGLSRWSKWRALAELEALGLVRVDRRPNKSPRVTVRHFSQD